MSTTEQSYLNHNSEQSEQKYAVKSISIPNSSNEGSDQQIKIYDNIENYQLLNLRQEIKMKNQELLQKNEIIKQLQERCMAIGTYEKKIQMLENKSLQLEKLLDRMEKKESMGRQNGKQKQNKQSAILIQDQYIVKENKDIKSTNQTNQAKGIQKIQNKSTQPPHQLPTDQNLSEKQNSQTKILNNSRPPKLFFQHPPQPIKKQPLKQKTNLPTILIQSTSSKFIQSSTSPFTYSQQLKHKQIDQKFNKLKQNIQHKPRSSRNMQQIYSLLNNYKINRQDLVVRQINYKLQNILNQSVKLNNSRDSSRDKHDLSFSGLNNNCRNQWKRQASFNIKQCNTQRPRCQTFNLSNSFTGSNKYDQKINKHQTSYNSNMYYKPTLPTTNSKDIIKRLQNKKYKQILNATNVQDILRARKCYSTLSNINANSKNAHKTSDIFGQKYERSNKLFWK